MEQQSNYKPGSVRGRVSDIRVLDEHGNVVEHFEGGDNTISSGASFDLLAWSFFPYTNNSNASQPHYTDANGYLFPNLYELCGFGNNGTSFSTQNLVHNLFGQIMGIKGGANGLSSHQTVISNMTAAWCYMPAMSMGATGSDLQSVTTSLSGANYPSNTYITYTVSNSISSNGVPSITLTVTVNSTSSALAYTIDSIAWIPCVEQRESATGSFNNGVVYQGWWTPNTSNTLAFTPAGASNFAAQTASPTAISTYVSALFVLPYTVTVNPGGAFQFSYTFQGA